MADPSAPTVASPWAPLRERVFAAMWLALLVSHIGTWMRDVGAGWLMTSMSNSATDAALVQVATTLPLFLISLPAGTLADLVDRRRLLLAVACVMALVSALLAAATHEGLMTPNRLLLGLFAAGLGTAVMTPVLQSLTPLMVERGRLREAIALNSMGLNVSRAIGPALGGFLVAAAGVAWTFAADALSYMALIAALWWWRGGAARAASGRPESFAPAMRTGLRYVAHAPELRRVLLRAAAFFIFASAYWALLPVLARRQLQGDATYYGILLACIGLGAVTGALVLPKLRQRHSANWLLGAGTAATSAVLLSLAHSTDRTTAAIVLALAGAAWIVVLTTVNVAAQSQLPNWIRGRGMAVYLAVFYGAMSAGSLGWGRLSDIIGISMALTCASALGLLSLLLARSQPLSATEPDLKPALAWADPVIDRSAHGEEDLHARGPVMVTIAYQVLEDKRAAFLGLIERLSGERWRDGAYQWGVFEHTDRANAFVEVFFLGSWADHERQHARATESDLAVQRHLATLLVPGTVPLVSHAIAAQHVPASDLGVGMSTG